MAYEPPCTLTPTILTLVADITERLGRFAACADANLTPRLRRTHRIRTIHASLAIENNTLSEGQVTSVIEGRRVLGHPREIQEVRNAFTAYEAMAAWSSTRERDLLSAHGMLIPGVGRRSGPVPQGWRWDSPG